jgi:photosystem II stability/assembly factor-like uncharacterized protein
MFSKRLLLLALAAPLSVAAAAPDALGDLKWRSIGPYRGGRVLATAGDPGAPNHFYFGSVNGGVWESGDAGRTWSPVFDAAEVGSIGAIALAPSQPQTIYVGTGEADMRSDIAQGRGVFKSTDGGKTWSSLGLADTRQISRVVVDPTNPDRVFVAAMGHPYAANADRGVFASTDGGRTWTKSLFVDGDTGAIDLTFKPDDARVLYAALWSTRRPPWNVYPPSRGPTGGLYRSTDGGATWGKVNGLPAEPGRIGIGVTPAAPDRVCALVTDAGAGQTPGLFRSDDGGVSWRLVNGTDKRITERGWYFGEIAVNPKNADELWVMDTVVLHSTDGGVTFAPEKGDPTGDDFHHLWIDPSNPARRIMGSDQGAIVTQNGGRTWSSWFNQPTGQFYHVAVDNRFPYWVYGAQQDSGSAAVPSNAPSFFDGITGRDFKEITPGGESDNIAPDPDDPDVVFGGRVERWDRRTDQVKSVDPTLAWDGDYRRTWTLPLVFGPDRKSLYFSNQRLFRTRDGGETWTPLSGDLTREAPGAPANLNPATIADVNPGAGPREGVIYAIGPSPRNPQALWVGTDDGLIWRTGDDGHVWKNITPAFLTPWSKIAAIEPSHFSDTVAYAAIDRHRLNDDAPHLLVTRDGGAHWSDVGDALPARSGVNSVNVVREDPVVPGLLYAGTEQGAFVSFDDGAHWRVLGEGLPNTSVRDIVIKDEDVVIATHGRGFYILDDIGPLRAQVHGSDGLRLYPPSPAIRAGRAPFAGTPTPRDEPMGENRPRGAAIDYFLPADAKGPVTITVREPRRGLAWKASSADPAPAYNPRFAPVPAEWLPAPKRPDTHAGHHRLWWSFGLPTGDEASPFDPGPIAPPGVYTVTLAVDGAEISVPLTVQPDPRLKGAKHEYDKVFDLELQTRKDRSRAATAAKAAAGETKQKLEALVARLEALEQALASADNEASPDALKAAAETHAEVLKRLP